MRVALSDKAGLAISAASLLALAVVMADETRGERLPIRAYTLGDGLPHGRVRRIVQDRHGFIWLCTPIGLSRFDGYRFTNYGMAEGLPMPLGLDRLDPTTGQVKRYSVADGLPGL